MHISRYLIVAVLVGLGLLSAVHAKSHYFKSCKQINPFNKYTEGQPYKEYNRLCKEHRKLKAEQTEKWNEYISAPIGARNETLRGEYATLKSQAKKIAVAMRKLKHKNPSKQSYFKRTAGDIYRETRKIACESTNTFDTQTQRHLYNHYMELCYEIYGLKANLAMPWISDPNFEEFRRTAQATIKRTEKKLRKFEKKGMYYKNNEKSASIE